MISYQVYKLVHLLGIMFLLSAYGGILTSSISGFQLKGSIRKFNFILHGTGLLLILVGGFGMLARLGTGDALPPWIQIKLAVWVLLGAGVMFAKRKASILLYGFLFLIAMIAPYAAIYKDFI